MSCFVSLILWNKRSFWILHCLFVDTWNAFQHWYTRILYSYRARETCTIELCQRHEWIQNVADSIGLCLTDFDTNFKTFSLWYKRRNCVKVFTQYTDNIFSILPGIHQFYSNNSYNVAFSKKSQIYVCDILYISCLSQL